MALAAAWGGDAIARPASSFSITDCGRSATTRSGWKMLASAKNCRGCSRTLRVGQQDGRRE